MTIFGNFKKNYTYIFHNTEDQMVIFGCLVCVNLNWIKNYNKMLDKMKKKSYYCIISGRDAKIPGFSLSLAPGSF
jgi:hypothetical protein